MLEMVLTLINIMGIAIGIGFVIFIHELGHFIMCKVNKVKVEKFSLFFGPAIFKKKLGETEYRLSLIPLGGYVKMAGEDISHKLGDNQRSFEFRSKTRWQRFQIYVAGSLMNIIFAFPICIMAFLIGRYVPSPIIGIPGKAELLSGMKAGDKILAVNNHKITGLHQYKTEMANLSDGEIGKVKVQRDGKERELEVVKGEMAFHNCLPVFNVIAEVKKGSVAERCGLRAGDEIIDVNGKPIYRGPIDLYELIRNSRGTQTLMFHIKRPLRGATFKEMRLAVLPDKEEVWEIPQDKNLLEPIVAYVEKGFPADGKLFEGDIIKKVDGTEVKSIGEVEDIVKKSKCKNIVLDVLRKGVVVQVPILVLENELGEGSIFAEIKKTNILAHVREGTFYYDAGLRDGDEILFVGDKTGDVFVSDIFNQNNKNGNDKEHPPVNLEDLTLKIKRDGKILSLKLPYKKEIYGAKIGIVVDMHKVFCRDGIIQAISDGSSEIYGLGVLTVEFLYKIFVGQESAKQNLSGPVGIARLSFLSMLLGLGNLLWILAIISMSLGIMNLLPIPVLDGGYIPLLVIEKIRNKPLSEKFMLIYQYIGVVLLLLLVVFVTFLDTGILPR